ncbi:flagellar hook-length control protein FliK [Spirochaeta isovalerica]|uniref:Flagellar hook-length control protein FliK n=1 Tax=Spirochaeta isovalerica TaxID=150 RepID=A0A841RD54_9SPIO|nr:flagellar hook-length control protein FliK [Spirochaeta isovalerica]MBB6481955.1 flagellar hook-length control protein FliK [Spirochaeta isovalerica]
MTSTINALIQSGPPDQKSRTTRTESPPLQDGSDSRFKDSLEKAMKGNEAAESEKSRKSAESAAARGEKEIPEGSKKTKSTATEQKISTAKTMENREGIRKPGLKLKTEAVPVEEGEISSDKSASVISEEGEQKKAGSFISKSASENSRHIAKKDLKPAASDENDKTAEQAAAAGLSLAVHDKENPGKILNKKESGEKTEDSDNNNDNVIIPFPRSGDGKMAEATVSQAIHSPKADIPAKEAVSSRKKGKEQPVLTVVDSRTKNSEHRESAQALSKASASMETADQTSKESNQIVLGEQNLDRAAGEESKSFHSRFSENREVMLARELRETGNDQIVKKASFVLKDNNQGEIKLILKPEALGRVKIHLDMNENNLVGKIIVENSRVGQIFENNLSNLSKAFEEAGISSSSIEVTVGDGNGNREGNQSFRDDQPFFSERLKTLDDAVPSVDRMAAGQGTQHINLVV